MASKGVKHVMSMNGAYHFQPSMFNPVNETAHFKKGKQLFEYQHLLLLKDIWWSKF